MTQRLMPALLAALALSTLTSRAADARVRIAGDFSSTLPLGTTERVADPALGVRGKVEWMWPRERLVVGVLGGQVIQAFRLPGEPTLSALTIGAEVAWIFGPKEWGTRPYVGFQTGYAHLSLSGGDAEFNRPSGETSSGGFFVVPEGGLLVTLTKHFGLRFDFRFVYLRSSLEMAVGDYRTYDAQTLGLGAGAIVTF